MSNRKGKQLDKVKQLKRERDRRQGRIAQLAGGARLHVQLRDIEHLIEDGDLPRARAELAKLDREFPGSREVLAVWCDVCYELKDTASHAVVCEKLYSVEPRNADIALMLAGLYLENERPTLASAQFARFLRDFPKDPRADDVRRTQAMLEPIVAERTSLLGLADEPARQVLELHERSLSAISRGEPEQACRWIESLLVIKPDFVAALNNLAEAQVQLGRVDAAVDILRRGLQVSPANAYCQGSLVRALILLGQVDEARRVAAGFNLTADDTYDAFLRQAEALLLLDQNEAVWGLPKLRAGRPIEPFREARLLHFTAVAALRLGKEPEAKQFWKRALDVDPEFSTAREQLDDLRLPVGKRHGPWLCPLAQWISTEAFSDALEVSTKKADDSAQGEAVTSFQYLLDQFPRLLKLIPILLDWGDETSRKLAIELAQGLNSPQSREALLKFGLGQRGPDDLRFKVVTFLRERGAVPERVVKLWREGEQREMLMHGFEIHYEPQPLADEAAQSLHNEAYECLKNEDGEQAEQLLRQALQLVESPSLLFNLATAIDLQGRTDEAASLFQDVHERFPDYFHGIVWRAKQLIKQCELAQAGELLENLRDRGRFHFMQFTALCDAEMELLLAQGNKPAAKSWLELLERFEPNSSVARHWRRRLAERKLFGRFGELLPFSQESE